MNRLQLPYVTQSSGISALDINNLYRVRDIDTKIDWLNKDDGTFYRLLQMLPAEPAAIQPVYYWIEDSMLDIHTNVNNASGYTSSDTSIVVQNSLVCVVNTMLACPRTGELLYVTAVNHGSNTLTVTRGYAGTAAAALVDTDVLVSIGDMLPEKAVANDGNGSVPGRETFNFISRVSTSFSVSDLQQNSTMVEGIGQVPWESAQKMLEMKRKINKALIFSNRAVHSTSDGPLYISGGFLSQLSGNVLDLAGVNGELSWPVLNGFLSDLFNYKASSPTKVVNAGSALFQAFTRIQKALDKGEEPYFEPTLGTQALRVVTDEGYEVQVVLDKWGFSANEGLGGWGLVMDLAHISTKEMNGEPLMWRPNIQANNAHVRQDELFGSFSLKVKHAPTHGLIRGATGRISI